MKQTLTILRVRRDVFVRESFIEDKSMNMVSNSKRLPSLSLAISLSLGWMILMTAVLLALGLM
jgi:hypothetical protein